MKDWQIKRLDCCLEDIIKYLDIKDTILKLKVNNLINADDEQQIMDDSVFKTVIEKREKIVQIIKTSGERAYWTFCHIIKTKTKTSPIFNYLHNDGGVDVENVCIVCNEEEKLSNCNYCAGERHNFLLL